ncbi:MAG: class I SAM-dependent methyltransferase [Aestuariivirga sp.]
MPSQVNSIASSLGLKRRSIDFGKYAKARGEVGTFGDDPFSKLFYQYEGERIIHKWGHYLPIYSRLFAPYQKRTTPLRFLEIGVSKGGSMQLWRSFFGKDAIIYGIDIDPACSAFDDEKARIRIGSQADPEFLASVVKEMGGVDIVLDDGSHVASDQKASFEALFPLLAEGGLYVVEDLHTSYWPRPYNGGYLRAGTFVEFCKYLIDDMHGWYHDKTSIEERPTLDIGCMQVFDSIVAFEKRKTERPFHIKVGG